MLSALLAPLGSRLDYLGIAGDREGALRDALQQGLERDVLVIAGGVSVGQYDLVPGVLKDLGVRTVFHRCAIKPGKPVLFGIRGAGFVFGLPGNPQSCLVVFHVLLRAALAVMSGAQELPPVYKTGKMDAGFRNRPGRKNFLPCRVETREGTDYIVPLAQRGSADIVTASSASAFFAVPRGVERVARGQLVEFFEV
jgi:molybdopterin molybdotransferase